MKSLKNVILHFVQNDIAKASPSDINDLTNINTNYFARAEQTNNQLGVPTEMYRNYAEHITTKAVKAGQLFTAKIKDYLIGYCIWEDYCNPLINGLKPDPEVYKLIDPEIEFVRQLEGSFERKSDFMIGDCARLMQVAVLPEYQNKGIASKLVAVTIEDIKAKGYRCIVADCTADNSWRILKKFDFKIVSDIAYSDFNFMGTNPFAKLTGKRRLVVYYCL